MKIDKKFEKEIIRFLIAGAFAGAVDFGVYYFLIHFFSFSFAKGISFICSGIIAYLFNKYWTFQYGRPTSYSEFIRYLIVNFLALGINILINQVILDLRPGSVFLALIIASMFTGFFTFVCFKWLVFGTLLKDVVYFMWWRWLPWRFLLRDAARRQGFLDPVKVFSQLQNFTQPSEVAVPTELLRSGVVLHARGLINSLAIQHNLDWIWPYWVECQYNPRNEAFIPRSFSLTQINLTHRNWTALGIPDGLEFPLVDPRGLVTPYYDGWSIDAWIIPEDGEPLIPSRNLNVSQKMAIEHDLCVITESNLGRLKLQVKAGVIGSAEAPLCSVKITGFSPVRARLIVSLRPYNPEGVSFINNIALLEDLPGWRVNRENFIYFDKTPAQYIFSDYNRGDVYNCLSLKENRACFCLSPEFFERIHEKEVLCKVGMASSAALFMLKEGEPLEIAVSVPLTKKKIEKESDVNYKKTAQLAWEKSLQGACLLQIPDEHFQFLYESAVRAMVLHSPKEVYPGPFIYRRFWFRDAAFILYALLCAGLKNRVFRALDCFRLRQTIQGYFLSQEGEWDSNGEALWIMRQYCEMTGSVPPQEWKESINKAGKWICKKRLPDDAQLPFAGLLPPGFSAEHLGPNDFYYWDDFWAVAGLKASAFLCAAYKDNNDAVYFERESRALLESIDQSLKKAGERLKRIAMPASPCRRLDSGAIGSLSASYPLRIFKHNDPRIMGTVDFLMKNCLVHGGFFHDMTHSGINPYLTLHLSQALLRAGDARYFSLMTAVAELASSTGQWPESVHPRTGGGCMGDGQHVWAAAEWVLMIRNCFVREENEGLILCSGIPRKWIDKKQTIIFGPAPTSFGDIKISITPKIQNVFVEWAGKWFMNEPPIDIKLPGFIKTRVLPGTNSVELKCEADK